MLNPPVHDEIDEAFERSPFLLARKRPFTDIDLLAISIEIHVTEQVLEPAFTDERISFEVEENVSSGRRRQMGEANARRRLDGLVNRLLLRTPLKLDSRLLARAFVRVRDTARGSHAKGIGNDASAAIVVMLCAVSSVVWILVMPATRHR